jgi:predicted metal-dependent peptidase
MSAVLAQPIAPPSTVTQAHRSELSKVKIALMERRDSAFFTALCFSMKHVWDDTIPTAYCDGKEVHWSPHFFMDLANRDERIFLMIHEVMHAALLHIDPERCKGKDNRIWNIACDHVINLMLMDRGFKMPTGKWKGHGDVRFKGMSAEKVYDILVKEKCQDQPMASDLQVPGSGTKDSKEATAKLKRHIDQILVRAATQSRLGGDKPGTIPGQIEIYLKELLDPKLPWYTLLRRWFRDFDKTDFTWRRPNRRFFPDHHLPSLWGESMIDFVCAIDASGSVNDQQFHRLVSELSGIFRSCKPKRVTLLVFDTGIRSIHVIRSIEELKRIKFTGRGGTNVHPVIEWANANKPQGLMVFSDGEFSVYTTSKVPTLWVLYDRPQFTAPFGKVIHFTMKEAP